MTKSQLKLMRSRMARISQIVGTMDVDPAAPGYGDLFSAINRIASDADNSVIQLDQLILRDCDCEACRSVLNRDASVA